MNETKARILSEINESIETKRRVVNNPEMIHILEKMATEIVETLKKGGSLLICGNGGSASDALHIAGEIVGRFQKERRGYRAIALNADVATMTAIANDYGYEQVFSRQVEGLMNPGDILLGISTSGNSTNIIEAVNKAHEMGGRAFLFSGKSGGKLKDICELSIVVPSDITAHIQEAHVCLYHILCGIVEDAMIGE